MNIYLLKHIIKLCSCFVIVVVMNSCKKDFLENKNVNGVLLKEEYVVDLNTTGEYLNGIYAVFAKDVFDGYTTIYPELIADNLKPITASSGTTPLLFHYNWGQQADESQAGLSTAVNCNNISYACYRVIRTASFAIECADKYSAQDPNKAASIKGEALALRSYCNFLLLNIFAQPYGFTSDASHPGIVLIDSWDWTDEMPPRSTVGTCYQAIVGDLQASINLLKSSAYSNARFGKTSAEALLARVYLHMQDFNMAKSLSMIVITAVPFMTAGYPEKLFTGDETESILQMAPAVSAENRFGTTFASNYFRRRVQFNATNDIVSLLQEDPNDKRRGWVTNVSGGWRIVKYPQGAVPIVTVPALSYYQPVIRLAEMYLTAAEAYYQIGKSDSAIYYLDKIRQRANPANTATTVSGNALLELIYKERRKELAFEGFRMFDLLRWKKGIVRHDVLAGSPKQLSYPNNKAIAPLSRLDIDSYKIAQNPEY